MAAGHTDAPTGLIKKTRSAHFRHGEKVAAGVLSFGSRTSQKKVVKRSGPIGAVNIWCLPAAPLWWSNVMIDLQEDLREASAQMAAKGLSFRLKAPIFVPLKGERVQNAQNGPGSI